MRGDDLFEAGGGGKGDVVEQAAPQKGVGQVFLVVAGDEHNRWLACLHARAGFFDGETLLVELEQQVVGEVDIGLVDLVD